MDPSSSSIGRTPQQPSPVRHRAVEKADLRLLEQAASEIDGAGVNSTSPRLHPSIYVEPEVPDPFLIDEDEDEDDHDSTSTSTPTMEQHDESPSLPVAQSSPEIPAAVSIPLSISSSPAQSSKQTLVLPIVDKDVPPTPDSEEDEEELPEIYVPDLIRSTMFLPIPNTDPLTTLVNKYIYPPDIRPARDITGDWQRSDFHTLVMTNSWRALARMARDRLITSDPEDLTLVLGLWYLRLASLSRLRLFNQAAAECTNLFSVLNAIEPPSSRTWVFERILPFELEVMQTRLKYWAGEHMAYLDNLTALLHKCRLKARAGKSDPSFVQMWQERGARICLIIASQLMEMKDYSGASKLLEPLCRKTKDGEGPSPVLRSAIGRIYLQTGQITEALRHFSEARKDPTIDESQKEMDEAMVASAEGDWDKVIVLLRALIARNPSHFAAVNNLSVALLSKGKLQEAIDVLESSLRSSPSSVVIAEPFLFNLSTLYELRSASALDKKRDLLAEVAKWSGDGLKTTCLKMPAN